MSKLFHHHEFDDDDDVGLGIGQPPRLFDNSHATYNPLNSTVPPTPAYSQAPVTPARPRDPQGGSFDILGILAAPTPATRNTLTEREIELQEQSRAPVAKASSLFYGHESAMDRVSVEELLEKGDNIGAIDQGFKDQAVASGYNFGWIEGVYVRCTLSIFGVIMFLRLNWIFAQAGTGGAVGIIIYSASVTAITTMSLSAISTNGKVAAGGVYFMVSRCLGADIGVVVGLSLFVAQSLAVALNLVGFAEAVTNLETNYMIDRDWDMKIYAIIGLIGCFGIAFCGANFEVQSQKVLFVAMILALLMFFAGVFSAKPDDSLHSSGLSQITLNDNSASNYSPGESWVTVFGVFFPAVTGISAGSSISGDLADASDAIPRGTFLAVGTTTLVYLLMGLLMAACFKPEGLANITTQIDAIDIALVPPLVYLGVFAAGLSSALALIVGAPRILMALARDNVVNFLEPFKKGYFSMDEPLRGYVLVLSIAFVAIMCLKLNDVSPLVTNFYLVQYGFMNYAVAAAHFSKSPGWRPSFKYYNAYVCMLGAVLCGASMFMVGYATAIITLVLSIGVYQYVVYNKPDVNWGDSSQASMHMKAIDSMYQLEKAKQHVKNWRPQYLFLTGNLEERPDLVIAMKLLKKSRGIVIAGNVIIGHLRDKYEEHANAENTSAIMENGVLGFSSPVVAPSLLEGVESLLQISGLGKLKANTVIMGYKHHWETAPEIELEEYREIIRITFLTRHGCGIVRNLTTNNRLVLKPTVQPHVDVWWLVEDGGLTVLVAHLLIRHREFRETFHRLRLFIACDPADAVAERKKLVDLLSRFRIEANVIVVDKSARASEDTLKSFQDKARISDEAMLSPDVQHFCNIADQITKYSELATMVVVSLPVPANHDPVRQYFAYLEILSGPRPTMLIRGNQDTVLTYNS